MQASSGAVEQGSTSVQHEQLADIQSAEENRLLRSLPPADYAWLRLQLTAVDLPVRHSLIEPDVPIAHVWFVREGIGSVVVSDEAGGEVEAASVGHEGFIGLPILFEEATQPNRVVVQVRGSGWRIAADDFRRVLAGRPAVRTHCLRYAAFFMTQVSQTAACNRLHAVEKRCARWLLMTHDRVHGASFDITQEFLAMMLGVRRAGVSVAMHALQEHGLVTYSRGRITVLDRDGLSRASCGCYRITQDALARLQGRTT